MQLLGVDFRVKRGEDRRVPDAWIRQWGDPVLRAIAAPVDGIDEVLRRQVGRMQQRLEDVQGAGLAATQVGFLRRAFAFRVDPDDPVGAIVNPRVVDQSDEETWFLEGCLSFPGVLVEVRRPAAVRVEGLDLDGCAVTVEAEGFAASLVQHEIDHLDGVLTLDRAEPAERRRALAALRATAA